MTDRQTDRQTDGRTPHDDIGRACIASCDKNCIDDYVCPSLLVTFSRDVFDKLHYLTQTTLIYFVGSFCATSQMVSSL